MADRIGEFLVRIGAMTNEQVEKVLTAQKGGDTRAFGEIANALGFVDDNALMRYVDYLDKSGGDAP
jgi:hypothetical protein